MSDKERTQEKFQKMTATEQAGLIDGLLAIGNSYEKISALDALNGQLAHSHYDLRAANIRKRTPVKDYTISAHSILQNYAPLSKAACEEHELMGKSLKDAWRSRPETLVHINTVSDLFAHISKNEDSGAAEPSCESPQQTAGL